MRDIGGQIGNQLRGVVPVGSSLIRTIGSLALLVALGAAPAAAQQSSAMQERGLPLGARASAPQTSDNAAAAEEAAVRPKLIGALRAKGFEYGAPVFIRIFKQSRQLELWLLDGYKYRLFRTYPICSYSGALGPKLREGDRQAPEGFYFVNESQLNPNSHFHLSFDIGYPNPYDRAHGRTGNHLMIHGGCVSSGCYAMTNKGITEIYTLVDAALHNGQSLFEVHIFPFRMTRANMAAHAKSRWASFWTNLKAGYDYFQAYHRPPIIESNGKRYTFGPKMSPTVSPASMSADASDVSETCTRC